MINPALQDSKPDFAQKLSELIGRFERGYSFDSVAERACFMEGMSELAKVVVTTCESASISVSTGSGGVSGLQIVSQARP